VRYGPKVWWIFAALVLAGCAQPGTHLLQLHNQAQQDYQAGHLVAAKLAYEQLLRATPDNPIFWARLGNCNALLGDTKAAAADYQQALQRDPQLVKARFNLAILHLREAQAELIAASEQDGTPPQLKSAIQHLLASLPDLRSAHAVSTPPSLPEKPVQH